jgi:hypothetical protein
MSHSSSSRTQCKVYCSQWQNDIVLESVVCRIDVHLYAFCCASVLLLFKYTMKERYTRCVADCRPCSLTYISAIDRTKLRSLIPWATYTDRATATCWQSMCQLFRIEGATWSAWHPYGRILDFLDQNRYSFFQVVPQLYPWGWVDPVPDQLLVRKSGSGGNRTRTSESIARNWPQDHRGGLLSST